MRYPIKNITEINSVHIDLANDVIQIFILDKEDKHVMNHCFSDKKAMECFEKIPPQYVKLYLKSNKANKSTKRTAVTLHIGKFRHHLKNRLYELSGHAVNPNQLGASRGVTMQVCALTFIKYVGRARFQHCHRQHSIQASSKNSLLTKLVPVCKSIHL